jgi:hypothetical protein
MPDKVSSPSHVQFVKLEKSASSTNLSSALNTKPTPAPTSTAVQSSTAASGQSSCAAKSK